jgi:hypothetical protein
MAYVTKVTVWPTAVEIQPSVKELLDLYNLLVDRPDATRERFAAEVFSVDGEISALRSVRGTEGTPKVSILFRNPVADLIPSEIKRYKDVD